MRDGVAAAYDTLAEIAVAIQERLTESEVDTRVTTLRPAARQLPDPSGGATGQVPKVNAARDGFDLEDDETSDAGTASERTFVSRMTVSAGLFSIDDFTDLATISASVVLVNEGGFTLVQAAGRTAIVIPEDGRYVAKATVPYLGGTDSPPRNRLETRWAITRGGVTTNQAEVGSSYSRGQYAGFTFAATILDEVYDLQENDEIKLQGRTVSQSGGGVTLNGNATRISLYKIGGARGRPGEDGDPAEAGLPVPAGDASARAGKAVRYNAAGTATEFYVPSILRGAEWVRAALPAAAMFADELLTLVNAPTKQAAAPAQLSTHAGEGGNIRFSLDWNPPSGMIGWWIVPFVNDVEYPGRTLMMLNEYEIGQFVHFNNVAAPDPFYGVRVLSRLNQDQLYREIYFGRFTDDVGIPADAELRFFPATN